MLGSMASLKPMQMPSEFRSTQPTDAEIYNYYSKG